MSINFNWCAEKKYESLKTKGNLISFAKKLILERNLNNGFNSFKSRESQYYFKNYKRGDHIYQKLLRRSVNLPFFS